jgi:ribonuclease P protein component
VDKDSSAQTFQPERRLRQRAEFDRVFHRNVRSADRLFTVLACPGTSEESRLGMAISIKSTGGAVARNRVKRAVRESFRTHLTDLPKADFVVLSRPGIGKQSNESMRVSLSGHWRRIAEQCKTL